jgi:diguanylate cyclase (GGDEF)-like protein
MVADLGSISISNANMFAEIVQSANRDGLTQLANKRHFMDRLANDLVKAEKEHRNLSLFLFDIDHFKKYNDNNGHLAGDEALKITGKLLNEMVRSDDMAARYGGEEFAVILPNTDKHGALRLAEKVRSAVEQTDYPNAETQPLGMVSISGGVATFPEDAKSVPDLIRCADQALYQCKHAGRNRVHVYETRDLFEETSNSLDAGVQRAGGRSS